MKKHFSLIFITLLAGFSIFAIAGADPMINVRNYPLEYCFKQIQWYLISLIAIYCISKLSNQDFYRFSLPIYLFFLTAVWLLAIQHQITRFGGPTIIPFSQNINGATAWYYFPGVGSIQPSEFLKMAYLLALSEIIDNHHRLQAKQKKLWNLKLIGKIMLLTMPAALGILLQNDSGVMMILLTGTIAMILVSGISKKWICAGFTVLLFLAMLFYRYLSNEISGFDPETSSYRLGRIIGWLDPETYYSSYGFQLYQALLSMGTAGFFGHGFQSIVMAFPEPQTDFIFAVLITDAGFLAGLLLISVMAALDIYLYRLSKKTTDPRSRYLLSGLIAILGFQQFWNIGMVLGLVPITGITLPFISYGGSSLVSYMLMMGIVFNIESEIAGKVRANPQRSLTDQKQDEQKTNKNCEVPAR